MIRKSAIALIVYGVAIHLNIAFFRSDVGITTFVLGLLVWSCSPYAICAGIARQEIKAHIALGGVIPLVIVDSYSYYAVFVSPESSTSALALLFAPFWNLMLFMPLGMLAGHGIKKWHSGEIRGK
jgi:hypothetical protein